ncbi:hypothetical protein EMCG_03527 [[Emmonsia] crescens]|uniref:HNH nuclease domain-containing protein n=1 Tax=[Emmonsia] crescens TaxID=73230 RepID=A0A0G2HW35_9EURO|nr:hypothetical protein EMCG_03527 [Emmonsia crescens UAMH 3008]
MPSLDRSATRNVFFVLAPDLDKIRGGICAGPTYSESDFLTMLSVLIEPSNNNNNNNNSSSFAVYSKGSDVQVLPTANVLAHGTYVIRPSEIGATIAITEMHYYPRTLSLQQSSAREDYFRDKVRDRDKMCVVTGTICYGAVANEWDGFEVAHIVPLALEAIFVQDGLAMYVSDKDGRGGETTGINSPQNGFLLRADLHKHFDQYRFAINPYNGYKVYSFGLNTHAYHGLTLQAVCRDQNNQYCISAPLLWWHFQQAVLANMRGAGAPIFEDDFPPGTDQMGEILQGPMARQRMEFEMANRLHGVDNIGGQSR